MAAEKARLTVSLAMIGARGPASDFAMSRIAGPSMPFGVRIVLVACALFAPAAPAQTPPPPTLTDAAKAMIGAWEISNAAKDKVCAGAAPTDATSVSRAKPT